MFIAVAVTSSSLAERRVQCMAAVVVLFDVLQKHRALYMTVTITPQNS